MLLTALNAPLRLLYIAFAARNICGHQFSACLAPKLSNWQLMDRHKCYLLGLIRGGFKLNPRWLGFGLRLHKQKPLLLRPFSKRKQVIVFGFVPTSLSAAFRP